MEKGTDAIEAASTDAIKDLGKNITLRAHNEYRGSSNLLDEEQILYNLPFYRADPALYEDGLLCRHKGKKTRMYEKKSNFPARNQVER